MNRSFKIFIYFYKAFLYRQFFLTNAVKKEYSPVAMSLCSLKISAKCETIFKMLNNLTIANSNNFFFNKEQSDAESLHSSGQQWSVSNLVPSTLSDLCEPC